MSQYGNRWIDGDAWLLATRTCTQAAESDGVQKTKETETILVCRVSFLE
eukprot:SAG11_NODE_10680_length_812_cov_1.538569_2_plen_48_part_01